MPIPVDTEGSPGTSFPERVGPCRLVRAIGSGATGTVFVAEVVEHRPWAGTGDLVAMKLLHPELTRASRALRRFVREGRIGHEIRHPCVVRTHECASAEVAGATFHYIVQEYVEGTTLCDLIREWGVVPEPMLRRLGAQLARGLAAIHDAGAVHRDLKPSNVLLTVGHEIKIADLGIARLFEEDASLTATGDFVGTPHHASPEQFEGEIVGPEADLYAMGVLLHEAATGRLPFVSADRHGLRRLHVGHVPPPASTINPQVSALLDDLVAQLLEKAPASRPGPASHVAEILEQGEDSAWWRARRADSGRTRAARPRRVRHSAPLLGRTEELRALRSLLAPGVPGAGPRFLLVEGDAGMGKSRLADELVAEAEARQALVLWGGNAPSPSGGARGAIAQSLLDHFGSDDLERRLAAALGSSRRLAHALAAHLLGAAVAASARSPREDVTAAMAILVAEMARETRLVWVLEDLHFAPPGEIAMLASIVSAVDCDTVGIVGTTRPTLGHADRAALAALSGYERHAVPRLEEAHVRELLAHAAPTLPASSRLAASLTRRTDGVPYFLFELLRSLAEKGGKAELASLDAEAPMDVPASLRHLLLARLDGIDAADREILDAAAVVGTEVDPALVAGLLGRDLLDVLRAFARLERTHGVVRGVGERVAFGHHLLHEVVSDSLLPALRRELHGRVADAIETARRHDGSELGGPDAAIVVSHRVAAGQLARACTLGLPALRWLARNGRHADVADLAPRLLEGAQATGQSARAAMMSSCVHALAQLGRAEDARLLAEDALPVATASGDQATSIDLCTELARLAGSRGEIEDEDAWLSRALEAAERLGDPGRIAQVLISRGVRRMFAGQRDESRADQERAVACATEAGQPALAASALGRLSTLWANAGDFEKQHELLLEARQLAASADRAQQPGMVLVSLVQTHVVRGELADGRAVGQEALALAREFGMRPLEAAALTALAHVEIAAGNLEVARTLAAKAVAVRRATGEERQAVPSAWILAIALRIEGDLDAAELIVASSLEQARATHAPAYAARALSELAEIARSRGDVEAARRHFTEASAAYAAGETAWGVSDCLMRRARAEVEGGLLAEARSTFDEALRRQASFENTEKPSAYHVWRVIAGHCSHDLEGIAPPVQLHEDADLHVALHVAGKPGHLEQALRKLEHLSRHLEGEALERFWRCNVTARRARALAG